VTEPVTQHDVREDGVRPEGDGEVRTRVIEAPPGSPRWTWWARIPLRTRLVALIATLLALGLAVASIASITLVQRYLVNQVDQELSRNADAVVQMVTQSNRTFSDSPLPSQYYVEVDAFSGSATPYFQNSVIKLYGTPVTPDLTVSQVQAMGRKPFTVEATDKAGDTTGTRWRVMAALGRSTVDGSLNSIVYVGLPLADVQSTVHQLGKVLGLTAIAVVLFGAVFGYWALRRELRPLHTIETTAAAIAGGDLTQRIPQEPTSTEVGSLTASLNAMLAQIEESFAAREASEGRMRRFVSDASHELRTPLATIRGYGELFRMGALTTPDQLDDTMGRIEDSATRMGTLVNDLLALARLDEGRPVRSEPVDLTSLAQDGVRDLGALDPTRDILFVPLAPPGPGADAAHVPQVTVTGDEDRLRQVISNLAGNAARHTPEGTAVEFAVGVVPGESPDGPGRGVLEVRDHGPGISEDQAKHVFERFYRADSSRNRASGGSGLGLAIVSAIVATHGGTIRVGDTPGGGLTVHMELPLSGAGGSTATTTEDASSRADAAG
jgi:two-component system OmpR family sensor kinase